MQVLVAWESTRHPLLRSGNLASDDGADHPSWYRFAHRALRTQRQILRFAREPSCNTCSASLFALQMGCHTILRLTKKARAKGRSAKSLGLCDLLKNPSL